MHIKKLSKLPILRGVAYGNNIIPLNFNSAKFLGYSDVIPVEFMNAHLGMVVIVRQWENGMLLFHEVDIGSIHQFMFVGIKERVDRSEKLDHNFNKGITPEMRYFYLLMMLDKQHIEEWKNLDQLELTKREREKRIKKFQESFAGRLQKSIKDAGGTLVKFNKRGQSVDVTWKVDGQLFHSTIQQDFKMLELGFCAEGHDKDHSIASAIILAKQFIEEDLIHITRE